MITCMVYDSVPEERKLFRELLHREAAYFSGDEWNMEFPEKKDALLAFFRRKDSADFLCLDITPSGMVGALKKVREAYQEARLLLIADSTISPMDYLRPAVRPDALLLRPVQERKIQEVFRELLQLYQKQQEHPDEGETFAVDAKGGRTLLAVEKILYFESREKKIFVRAGRKEYGFYDTMEHLLEVLPDGFIRCHRSYIVNRSHVRRIVTAQNFLELDNGDILPVSRSYRAELKNL